MGVFDGLSTVMSDEMRTRLHELVMHATNYRSVMYLDFLVRILQSECKLHSVVIRQGTNMSPTFITLPMTSLPLGFQPSNSLVV